MLKVLNALIALVAGVGGTVVLFWATNALVERMPPRLSNAVKPYVFIGPALFVVTIFLVYPFVRTIFISFFDERSENFVGVDNYVDIVTDPALRSAMFNNLLWIAFVPTLCVAIGLIVAVLADRLPPRAEQVSKSIIFTPMAISAVGASTIWLFIYAWRPEGTGQIGLLNAIWTGLGQDPIAWVQVSTFRLNTFLLLIIMIWTQTGFAMVLLSSAIKGVPTDTIEAARIDGASEIQIFWRVTVPQISSTIAVVLTTILVAVLKVFDIVFVMTGGNFNTDVIANRFIIELFDFRRFGRAAAIVVALVLATIPVMVYNIRQFREQEAR
ncbi:MAG: carbohydrate ABC transporter permease [Egibacteraceae bacterium]